MSRGRARPEYRDLKRALDRDANIEAASLLRIQQDRFAASGTVDGEKVTTLPAGSEAWRKFDVIILGDLDVSFLTKQQQTAIEQAVSDGSGLLMVGRPIQLRPRFICWNSDREGAAGHGRRNRCCSREERASLFHG